MTTPLESRIGFGSDNHCAVHPAIMAALARENHGHQPSYGTDAASLRLRAIFARHFGDGTEAYLVFNGTAANVLALAATLKSHHAVICAESSHLHVDECAAPERVAGIKLLTCPTTDGKLRPADVERYLVRRGDQHFAQAAMISITQPTEVGTVYTPDEIRDLSRVARERGLLLHMDGARLTVAAESLGLSLRAITRDCGVDVVSFGGTKNGLLYGEAVVFLREGLAKDFKFVRKQLMQLPSKTRFIAAQFEAWLDSDLHARIARHSIEMAKRLEAGLRGREDDGVIITQATQANAVFVRLPRRIVGRLRERYFFYVMNELTFEARLMCGWDTTPEAVDGFLARLNELLAEA